MQSSFEHVPARVVRVVNEALNTRTYYFELDRSFLGRVGPGKYFMVYAWGLGDVPISISDIAIEGDKLLIGMTIRSVGAVTKYVLENVTEGSTIGVRGPYGSGWPIDSYKGWDVVVVAGGIGLAPLRPLIKEVVRNRSDYGALKLLYGARSSDQLLYRGELRDWSKIEGVEVLLSIDRPEPGWSEFVGFVTDLIDRVDLASRTVAYVCGPEIMMRKAAQKLLNRGLRPENIYLSLERRMRCGIGVCGTCQLGHYFVCTDGPVFKYSDLSKYLWIEGI